MLPLFFISAACLTFQSTSTKGQDTPAAKVDDLAYSKTLEKRASEILEELRLEDPAVAARVRETIVAPVPRPPGPARRPGREDPGHRGPGDLAKDEKAGRIEAERASTEAAAS